MCSGCWGAQLAGDCFTAKATASGVPEMRLPGGGMRQFHINYICTCAGCHGCRAADLPRHACAAVGLVFDYDIVRFGGN